jgi:hypothetical protein
MDERDLSGKLDRRPVVGRLDSQTHRASGQIRRRVPRVQMADGFQAIQSQHPRNRLARLDPFAAPPEDLNDPARRRRRDPMPLDLPFGLLPRVLVQPQRQLGRLQIVPRLLDLQLGVIGRQPQVIEFRFGDAVRVLLAGFDRAAQLGRRHLGRRFRHADLDVVFGVAARVVQFDLRAVQFQPGLGVVDARQQLVRRHRRPFVHRPVEQRTGLARRNLDLFQRRQHHRFDQQFLLASGQRGREQQADDC